jgi:hypothetical protein
MSRYPITCRLSTVSVFFLLAVMWTTQALPAHSLTAEEVNQGFHPLFDGNTLQGWHGYGGSNMTDRWHIKDGVLEINPASEKRSDLVTDGTYQDFELRLDWNISVGGNSGIMFNVAEAPEYSKPWKTGPEVQIQDDENRRDSRDGHRVGALYDLVARYAAVHAPAGEWNTSHLQVKDGLVRHWLNGVLTFEVQMWSPQWDQMVAQSKFKTMPGFGSYRHGHIVLQDHDDVVRFRNIRIREF